MLEFDLQLDKMTISGPLFDEQKLSWVNNNYLSAISTEELYQQTLAWAQRFQPEFASLLLSDVEYAKAAMGIERHTEKDPKRFTLYSDVQSQILFFFDEVWIKEKDTRKKILEEVVGCEPPLPPTPSSAPTAVGAPSPLRGENSKGGIKEFIHEYVEVMDLETDDVMVWFEQLKEI